MKKIQTILLFIVVALSYNSAVAQYYYDSNSKNQEQIYYTQSPMSSTFYKGFIDIGYSFGIGYYSADLVDITTTHGISFNNKFFLGAGIGVNFLLADVINGDAEDLRPAKKTTALMIPLYADMRLALGDGRVQPVIGCKIGCSFLATGLTSFNNGWIDDNTSAYFSPSIGVRIPLSSRSAFNLSVSYTLISQKYYYWDYWEGPVYSDGISLSSFGARLAIEW